MRFRLRWRDDGRELVSTEAYTTYHAAYQVMRDALQAARNRKSYSVESHGAEYRVRLKGGFAFVADSHPFSTRADAEAAIRDYEEWAEQFFHDTSVCVVEHLMLARPYSAPLPELLGAAPTPDPLSFQFSVVYRKSGPIFGDEQNRQAVWRLIAEEAPAHLAWSIHELEDDWDWLRFAKAYDGWRHVMQDAAAPDKQLIGAREHLLRELTKMRLAGLVA